MEAESVNKGISVVAELNIVDDSLSSLPDRQNNKGWSAGLPNNDTDEIPTLSLDDSVTPGNQDSPGYDPYNNTNPTRT